MPPTWLVVVACCALAIAVPVYWFLMQIGMILGFATSWPHVAHGRLELVELLKLGDQTCDVRLRPRVRRGAQRVGRRVTEQ